MAGLEPTFRSDSATVLACGGFDEDLSWRCRDEFVQRLAKTGNPFFYEPTAIGEFKCDKTAEQLTDEALAKGKEEIPFLRSIQNWIRIQLSLNLQRLRH